MKWRGASCKTTILNTGPSMSFHVLGGSGKTVLEGQCGGAELHLLLGCSSRMGYAGL